MNGTNNDWLKTVKSKLKMEGDRFLQESVTEITFQTYCQFMKEGERQSFEAQYFLRRRRLTIFGLLLYLYPDERAYLEALENEIWQICNEFTWCLPAHLDQDLEEQSYQSYKQTNRLNYTVDLFAAETAFSLAEIVSLFDGQLDQFLIDKIKIEVDRRIFTPYLSTEFHWETATHNWASVCAGSIGSAALYLLEGNEQKGILDRVIVTIEYYLKGFEDDGACQEGYGYWQYGFGYFIYFADLLRKYQNINLLDNPKVKRIAMFQQNSFLALNYVMNFADAEPKAKPMIGFTHYLHQQFPNVHVPPNHLIASDIVDPCGRWAPAIRELWWYDPTIHGDEWPEISQLFDHTSIFLSRWKEKGENYAFALKSGHNNEPHNHNDIGQFILYGMGQVFLRDLGSGQYNKAYFSDERYQFLCNSAEGHSVPVVNGYQPAGQEYKGVFTKVEQHASLDDIEVDMRKAYQDQTLEKFTRTFTCNKENRSLVLKDAFQFSQKPEMLIESFIAADLPYRFKEDSIVLSGDNGELELFYDNKKVVLTVRRRHFNNHQGVQECFLHILFELKQPTKILDLKFAFVFK
ncbi:heparinase II/III domain-containing protein [Gracilibacillus kekensis]|uniref:Heparinase II/III-like protein n=1 Tax=Gracilibacillus kekensis TaxID=1027249 RepID=A0A1M7NAB1_9BACI|nr:heparinase II/III family protein [Gracilibacillus kekensis]SHN00017.1 Heparinase II/III-like protein [Gracilibacillus kekensis]